MTPPRKLFGSLESGYSSRSYSGIKRDMSPDPMPDHPYERVGWALKGLRQALAITFAPWLAPKPIDPRFTREVDALLAIGNRLADDTPDEVLAKGWDSARYALARAAKDRRGR